MLLLSSKQKASSSENCGWLPALAATPWRLRPCVHCWCMACRWHRGMLALQCLRRPAGIETPQPLPLRWCAVLCYRDANPHNPCAVCQQHTVKCNRQYHAWHLCLSKYICSEDTPLRHVAPIAAAAPCSEATTCHGQLYQIQSHLSAILCEFKRQQCHGLDSAKLF